MVALVLVLLMVTAPLAIAAERAPDLFIEAVLDPPGVYVQAQVRYRVRLYRGSVFQQGDFITSEIPGVVTRLVAEDDPVEVRRGGHTYQMIERRYLLFPQRSGTLSLPGEIYSGRQVFARGEPLELEVWPAASAEGVWLPATDLTLSEVWRLPEPPWQIGAHLERRVSVEARGLTGPQIPPLALGDVPGLRHQRTRVRVDDRLQGFGILGRRTEHHLYVPTRAGRPHVPDYRLPWWDLRAGTGRIAQLPGRSFPIDAPPDAAGPGGKASTPATGEPGVPAGTAGAMADRVGRWFLVAAGTLLGTALLWWLALRGITERIRRRSALRRCLKRFEAACLEDDPAAAVHALLEWGRANWGPGQPLTLGTLSTRLDDPAAAAILRRLDAVIYSGQTLSWDGLQCLQGLRRILRSGPAAPDTRSFAPLPSLNP